MSRNSMRSRDAAWNLFAAALVLALAAGCGGGGGSGGEGVPLTEAPLVVDETLFQGRYTHTGAGGSNALSRWQAEWGQHDADGAGGFDYLPGINRNGRLLAILVPLPRQIDAYEIAANRSVLWNGPAPASAPRGRGGISPDGRLVGFLAAAPEEPMIHILARTSGASTVEQVNGSYHFGAFGALASSGSPFAEWGDLTADGIGGAALTLSGNVARSLFGPLSATATYENGGRGGLLFRFGASAYIGHVDETGDLVVAGGSVIDGEDPAVIVLLRRAAGASAALLDGEYFLVGIAASATSYTGLRGRLTADGAAGGTVRIDEINVEGTETTPGTELASSYRVAPDGTLTWDLAGVPYVGGVAADGSYGFFAGADRDGGVPSFFFFHR